MMSDEELFALAVLVKVDGALMDAENQARFNNGYAPAWTSEMNWPERDRLQKELERRASIAKAEEKI